MTDLPDQQNTGRSVSAQRESQANASDPLALPDRGHLLTEQRNHNSNELDSISTTACLELINAEDQLIAGAVRAKIPQISQLTDLVIKAIGAGGRLIYLGAGTSGRLGVLDASECPPTFQTDPRTIVGIIAGGDSSLRRSSEHKEDDYEGVWAELDELGVGEHDVILGIAAGGTTPYVLGGIEHANKLGASTGMLTCTLINKPVGCNILITIESGPEVLTGSTRMKAGTATKMVLNMITTGAMVGLGKSYSNMMVDLRATNDKLKDRAARIISQITGVDRDHAFELLDQSNQLVKQAIVMHKTGSSFDEATVMLDKAEGHLGRVIGSSEGNAHVD
jgi:N-acetylmuramic acid 6-phosphate etherase